jgi:hypothetical protein
MKGNFESVGELVQRVTEIETGKEDYLVPSNQMTLLADRELKLPDSCSSIPLMVNDIAVGQIVERMKINLPGMSKAYWDGMGAFPGMRSYTVNRWLAEEKSRRLVRTLEGKVRAFLSDSFKPWDNFDMLEGILPVLAKEPGLMVKSCSLTERRMYLQLVFPRLRAEVKVGDPVQAGITISNSEVGAGAWDVRSFIEVLRCSNGMVAESLIRKYHVGRKTEEDDGEVFKSDTIAADILSAKLQLRDVVTAALQSKRFEEKIVALKRASGIEIEDPVKTVEKVTKRFNLTNGEGDLIMKNLLRGGEPTMWGLSNAVTAIAHQTEDRDKQFDLERIGWDIIQLSPSEWKEGGN